MIRPIFSLISGSHLYGFESPDSDIDIRGVYINPTEKYLGLWKPKTDYRKQHGNTDTVLEEIGKFLNLIIKGNCNRLEWAFAEPMFVNDRPIYETLKFIGKDCICARGLFESYRGMSKFNYKKYILSDKKANAKKYLYVFRGLLAGIHVLETGEIEPNIEKLNKIFKIPEIGVLIDIKRTGEHAELVDDSRADLRKLYEALLNDIQLAFHNTHLPNSPSKETVNAINHFLIEIRKEEMLESDKEVIYKIMTGRYHKNPLELKYSIYKTRGDWRFGRD